MRVDVGDTCGACKRVWCSQWCVIWAQTVELRLSKPRKIEDV